MSERDAVELLRRAVPLSTEAQDWADLGAGSGVFASALSTLLADQSIIHAIDRDGTSLSGIRLSNTRVRLVPNVSDMRKAITTMSEMDGILMANSLHYIADQHDFLTDIKNAMKATGTLVIIEYDRMTGNQWVPFPVSYAKLVTLAESAGFSVSEKLASRPSRFGNGDIYTAALHHMVSGG